MGRANGEEGKRGQVGFIKVSARRGMEETNEKIGKLVRFFN